MTSSPKPRPGAQPVIASLPATEIDQLEPLWAELLAHHVQCAPHLGEFGEVRSAAESWAIRSLEYLAWLEDRYAKIITAVGEEQLVGYAFVRITPSAGSWQFGDTVGVLETLVVTEAARGQGVGRLLMEAAEAHCAAHGVATMRICVIDGNDARGFYQHRGAAAFTHTLLHPVPGATAGRPVALSGRPDATSSWTVVENITRPKSAAPNEDRLLVTDHCLAAVIDGATDKSGRDYGGATGGARAAQCISDTLAHLPSDATPQQAVDTLTGALAQLRTQWKIPADDPVAPSAVTAVLVPGLDLVWRVGDVHIALRRGEYWTHYPGRKRIDDVLASTRAAFLHCLLNAGASLEELAADDAGRQVILPVLEQQGRLANQRGPFCYAVLDGTKVPGEYLETFSLRDVDEVVLATDGFLSAAPTIQQAEDELSESITKDPLRIWDHPGTKAVKPGADSFDDRTYIRLLRQ